MSAESLPRRRLGTGSPSEAFINEPNEPGDDAERKQEHAQPSNHSARAASELWIRKLNTALFIPKHELGTIRSSINAEPVLPTFIGK